LVPCSNFGASRLTGHWDGAIRKRARWAKWSQEATESSLVAEQRKSGGQVPDNGECQVLIFKLQSNQPLGLSFPPKMQGYKIWSTKVRDTRGRSRQAGWCNEYMATALQLAPEAGAFVGWVGAWQGLTKATVAAALVPQ